MEMPRTAAVLMPISQQRFQRDMDDSFNREWGDD
jgi:hypothetical protein